MQTFDFCEGLFFSNMLLQGSNYIHVLIKYLKKLLDRIIINTKTTSTCLVASDVIVLKLVQSFDVSKYFNIFFGVIYRQT